MALPINIDDLINGKTVEWERIEFKKGWNPIEVLKSITAFANDFNNWGGGYIIIGIETNDGKPILPPIGLSSGEVEKINKELLEYCHRLRPNYFPISEPVDYQNKKIFILWVPGGSTRPYKCPESFVQNAPYHIFIRRFSSDKKASSAEERDLIQTANNIPFDDQVNHRGQLSDFDLSTIKSFLNEINSDLESQIPNLSIYELSRRMNIAEGPNEYLLPKNVGLLFFAKNPHQFFPYAKIEIVSFKDEEGDSFNEKIFTGPLHTQLRAALLHIKNLFIEEKISKVTDKAEADRYFNYPYAAIEEALSNAVFHRGYDDNSTIEIRVFPSRIDIISYPGPLPPLNKEKLKLGSFDIRKYRNRRIGDFLKELHLTEGRATGIPKIKKALEKNGSPLPIFETDDDSTYFKTSFQIHPAFIPSTSDVKEGVGRELVGSRNGKETMLKPDSDQVRVQVSVQANFFIINNLDEILTLYISLGEQAREQVGDYVRDYVRDHVDSRKIRNLISVLKKCEVPQKRTAILSLFNLVNNTINFNSHITVMLKNGILERTVPDKPKSSNQKYRTTEKGNLLLAILSEE